MPTPDELAHWLAVCTRAERINYCAKVMAAHQQATLCLQADHASALEQVKMLVEANQTAYQRGWDAALATLLKLADDKAAAAAASRFEEDEAEMARRLPAEDRSAG